MLHRQFAGFCANIIWKSSLSSANAIEFKTREPDMSIIRAQARNKVIQRYVIGLVAACILSFLPAASRAQSPTSAEQIAKAYGLDSFGQIETIRYTWNVDAPNFKVSRTWEWSPKSGLISYEGKDKEGKPVKASYQRSQLDSQSDAIKKEIDPAFSNDQYWLLLPFHIAWDGAAVSDDGQQKLPLGDGSAERVVAKYPSDGGYQPGDTWELYIGPDKRIQEMVYRRGADNPPHVVMASYADYKKAGPLLFSTEHRGTVDGQPLHLFLTDIAVKLTGSDKWINAQ
jgi:hypothetical protein